MITALFCNNTNNSLDNHSYLDYYVLNKDLSSIIMYVCICNAVTDKQIEASVEDGATTMKQLSAELKVGSQCGKCCQCAKKVLNKKLIQIAEQQPCVA